MSLGLSKFQGGYGTQMSDISLPLLEKIDDLTRRVAALEKVENGGLSVIHDETLTAAGRFDVSSIPQNFANLLIILHARSNVGGVAFDRVHMFFNGDTTTTNYYNRDQDAGGINNTPEIGFVSAATATSDNLGVIAVLIPNYAATLRKNALGLQANAPLTTNLDLGLYAFRWQGSAAALTRVTLQPDGYSTDKFITGSRLQILGLG